MSQQGISNAGNGRLGAGCLGLFGLAFVAIGGIFLYVAFISPFLQGWAAEDWIAGPCTIVESTVKSHVDSDGTTYSPDIRYRYRVDGQEHVANQYSFSNFSGPRFRSQSIVEKYPEGAERTCYYDPESPGTAVLDRDNRDLILWAALIPLVFILVGGGIMLAALWGWWRGPDRSISGSLDATAASRAGPKSAAESSGVTGGQALAADQLDQEWSAPRKLKSTNSRWGVFVVLLLFGLFWNGMLSVFAYNALGFGNGFQWFQLFFLLFLIPFLLVGLGLIAGAVYCFLAIFNPRVEVALTAGAVPLGGEVEIAWEVEGKVERIKELKIEVHAQQSATYTRGTDTVTETDVFERIPVMLTRDVTEVAFGSRAIRIPVASMHTFKANRNEIQWTVEVHGTIPMAPDIHESFPFRVTPVTESPGH